MSGLPVDRIRIAVYVLVGLAGGAVGSADLQPAAEGQRPARPRLRTRRDHRRRHRRDERCWAAGRRSSGTVLGAVLIETIRNGLNLLNTPPAYQRISVGLLLIAALAMQGHPPTAPTRHRDVGDAMPPRRPPGGADLVEDLASASCGTPGASPRCCRAARWSSPRFVTPRLLQRCDNAQSVLRESAYLGIVAAGHDLRHHQRRVRPVRRRPAGAVQRRLADGLRRRRHRAGHRRGARGPVWPAGWSTRALVTPAAGATVRGHPRHAVRVPRHRLHPHPGRAEDPALRPDRLAASCKIGSAQRRRDLRCPSSSCSAVFGGGWVLLRRTAHRPPDAGLRILARRRPGSAASRRPGIRLFVFGLVGLSVGIARADLRHPGVDRGRRRPRTASSSR